jgi:hypothetical protein
VMSQLLCSKEAADNIVNVSELLTAAIHEVKVSGRLKFILRSFLDLNNLVMQNNINALQSQTSPISGGTSR